LYGDGAIRYVFYSCDGGAGGREYDGVSVVAVVGGWWGGGVVDEFEYDNYSGSRYLPIPARTCISRGGLTRFRVEAFPDTVYEYYLIFTTPPPPRIK